MTLRLPALLALSPLVFVAAGAFAETPAAPAYFVKLTLKQGATLLGTPGFTIASGQTARVAADAQGGAHYLVAVSVTGSGKPDYLVKLALDTTGSDGAVRHVEPALSVQSGQPAALTLGTADAPLDIGLTVTSVKAADSL